MRVALRAPFRVPSRAVKELINEEIVDETDLYIDVAHEEAGVAEDGIRSKA